MAATVESSHFPLGAPLYDLSLLSAVWISEMRSTVGACCPRSFRRPFLDEALRVLLFEEEADEADLFVVLFIAALCPAAPPTHRPPATSSVIAKRTALRKPIRRCPLEK